MTDPKSNPTVASADRTLTLTRVFDAPRHLVFQAWTEKKHLDRWSAPHGFTIPLSEGDLRPGGVWRCLMIKPDGEKFPVSGVYREIIPNELIVMTHGWEEDDGSRPHETIITIRFADENGKTRMTFHQEFFKSVESRDGHQGGWTECFEKLGQLLEQIKTEEKV